MNRGTALRHNALVYASAQEYAQVAVPFLREGLELGQGAVVAHTRDGIAAVREALGSDAARIAFVDVGQAYTRPARTLAAYHEVYADQLGRYDSLRAVADVQVGDDPAEWELWTGYEAVFNRSFAHLPVWVLCSYDSTGIPQPVLDGVWETHPEVVSRGAWHGSDAYDDRDVPFVRREVPALQEVQHLDTDGDLEQLRERVVRALLGQGLPEHRALDLLLASTEVLANALGHGHGVKALRTGRVGGRQAVEVVDNGAGLTDPAAVYLAPRDGLGSGLWVARQLAWDLEFRAAPDGFTTRITA